MNLFKIEIDDSRSKLTQVSVKAMKIIINILTVTGCVDILGSGARVNMYLTSSPIVTITFYQYNKLKFTISNSIGIPIWPLCPFANEPK